jgi:lichenan operon transcriptional antiterminator
MSSNVKLPEGFYESVMERESLHSTDYSPYVAVPHPTKLVTEEDIVAVAVLDRPVFWGRYEIQVLLCAFLSMNDEEPTQLFYEVTSHFITDRKMVDQLVRDPSYSTLIGILGTVRID